MSDEEVDHVTSVSMDRSSSLEREHKTLSLGYLLEAIPGCGLGIICQSGLIRGHCAPQHSPTSSKMKRPAHFLTFAVAVAKLDVECRLSMSAQGRYCFSTYCRPPMP